MKKRIIRLLKSLEDQGEISEKEKNDLYTSGSQPGVLYGLTKIHEALEGGIPSFRSILSAIGTPAYKLAKFCEQLLKPLTKNECTIKDSFLSAKEVLEFEASLFMASFDIKSLFTDIPLTETLNLCVENLYRNQTHVGKLSQTSFYSFNFETFMSEMQKRGSTKTLFHKSFRLYSSYENFHREIKTLKSIFKHNSYPQNFVNQCIKKFLNKLFFKKDHNFMVPKRELTFVLTYLGKL